MKIELQKEKVCLPVLFCEQSMNQNIDLEINLPDYCSDIKRILKCFVLPGINSVQTTGDRASAKGDVIIRLVYVGDNEKIDCYEQSVDLSTFVDIKNMPENSFVSAKATTQFVNCRAASKRRFVVGSSVCVNFSVYSCIINNVCQNCCKAELETKINKIKAVSKSALSVKMFDLSETIALKENAKPIGKILGTDCEIKIDSVKTVSGKILLKGSLDCKITYCSDTKERTLEKLCHSLPISQIIEVSGINDDFVCEIKPNISSVAVCPKADSSGNNNLVEFAAKISVLAVGTKEEEVSFVCDCYSTQYETKAEYKTTEFRKCISKLNDKKSVNSVFDFSEQMMKDVLDVKVLDVSHSETSTAAKYEGKAGVLLGITFCDSKDKIQYIERNADFNFDCNLSEKYDKLYCEAEILIQNLSYSVNSSKLTVNFDGNVSGNVFCVISKNVLENCEVDDEKEKCSSSAAVTVYYCSKGENLWEIAKKYNTSEKLIKEENSIETEILKEDGMLIIPCV